MNMMVLFSNNSTMKCSILGGSDYHQELNIRRLSTAPAFSLDSGDTADKKTRWMWYSESVGVSQSDDQWAKYTVSMIIKMYAGSIAY